MEIFRDGEITYIYINFFSGSYLLSNLIILYIRELIPNQFGNIFRI
jgi:hypothetical protein